MKYVLVAPKGHYFVDPSFFSWDFTTDIKKATKYNTRAEAEAKLDAVNRAVACTHWGYSDDVPFPTIKEVE